MVYSCGLALLWQNAGLKRDSKLAKESQKLLTTVIDQLESESPPAAAEFSSLVGVLVSLDGSRRPASAKSQTMSPPAQKPSKSPKKQLQSLKARLMAHSKPSDPTPQEPQSRRATISGASPHMTQRHIRSSSWTSLPPDNFNPLGASYPSPSMPYLNGSAIAGSAPSDAGGNLTATDWELVLSDMDRGYSNIFTGIYGGKEVGEDHGPFASLTAEYSHKPDTMPMALPGAHELQGLSPEEWSATSSSDVGAHQAPQSVLSFSDESLGSLDDGMPFNDLHQSPEEHANMLDPSWNVLLPPTKDGADELGLANDWDRRLAV